MLQCDNPPPFLSSQEAAVIVRPRPHWIHLLFVRRGSLVPRIFGQQLFIFLLSSAVVLAHGQLFTWKIPLTAAPFSLMGVALAIFLGFRINASYDRYWEARKQWGLVLIECRNLSRKVLAHLGHNADSRALVLALAGFAAILRNQLREQPPLTGTDELLPTELRQCWQGQSFVPNQLLLWLGERLHAQRLAGRIDSIALQNMENSLDGLSVAMGCCERIANTPLPFTYTVILHRSAYVFCMLLPFGLVDAIGWITPLVVAFISYTFFALEELSDEIGEPFGLTMNDLALDAIVRAIEVNLRQMLGDTPPPLLQPDENYLLT
jgi:putative membrane protein